MRLNLCWKPCAGSPVRREIISPFCTAADEGITGCNTRKRDGFNRMVGDALAGKIDLVVTKSVSRFARNTVDSLTTIRTLKEHGVEVYFEKENIWTFDGKGELMISIMSSLAQEESRSISENCVWGQRKRFADGKVTVPFGRFLGYDRGPDGNLVVNEEQAKVVRRIYALFLEGNTPYAISKILTEDSVPTPGGKKNWSKTVVLSILKNEKYKGDTLLQKVYTEDFLTKKKVRNSGQVPQYYVEGNHEAIVSPEVFDLVQEEIARRRNGASRYSGVQPFSGMVYCGGLYGPEGLALQRSVPAHSLAVYPQISRRDLPNPASDGSAAAGKGSFRHTAAERRPCGSAPHSGKHSGQCIRHVSAAG